MAKLKFLCLHGAGCNANVSTMHSPVCRQIINRLTDTIVLQILRNQLGIYHP